VIIKLVNPLVPESKLRNFGYTVAFLALVALLEFGIIQFSTSLGVSDSLVINLGAISISPLLHVLPLIVIIVLTLSWLYLNEALKLASYRKRERPPEKLKKKRKVGKIGQFLQKIKFPEQLKKIAENNIFKGAFATIIFFTSLVLIIYLIVYPDLLYNFTYSMFKSNPSILGFAIAIRNFAFSIGQTISPLGWIASSIDNGLKAAAPGFRNSFSGFGSLVNTLASLDANSKYIICQNLAAWIPALTIIAYGKYISRPRIVRIKRRKRR